jgi:hypothetical protein
MVHVKSALDVGEPSATHSGRLYFLGNHLTCQPMDAGYIQLVGSVLQINTKHSDNLKDNSRVGRTCEQLPYIQQRIMATWHTVLTTRHWAANQNYKDDAQNISIILQYTTFNQNITWFVPGPEDEPMSSTPVAEQLHFAVIRSSVWNCVCVWHRVSSSSSWFCKNNAWEWFAWPWLKKVSQDLDPKTSDWYHQSVAKNYLNRHFYDTRHHMPEAATASETSVNSLPVYTALQPRRRPSTRCTSGLRAWDAQ